MANEEKNQKSKSDEIQDKILRDYMKKEMLKKIERRVENEESGIFKTLKSYLGNDPSKKNK